MYTIKAWLPGLPYFVAEKGEEIGLLTPEGFFPRKHWFLGSAVAKHGYRLLREPREVVGDKASVEKLQDQLERLEAA